MHDLEKIVEKLTEVASVIEDLMYEYGDEHNSYYNDLFCAVDDAIGIIRARKAAGTAEGGEV